MRPDPNAEGAGGQDLAALPRSGRQIALAKALPSQANASVTLDLEVYGGPNEMVRYLQENYLDLPGLFRPNILGRVSLGIVVALETIHGVVGNWGLSIIVLTLLFRILVWPLIATQTKSMMGMQQLQPKLQALQKKHKDNREKLTEETMKLYKEAGVNPAGGLLADSRADAYLYHLVARFLSTSNSTRASCGFPTWVSTIRITSCRSSTLW